MTSSVSLRCWASHCDCSLIEARTSSSVWADNIDSGIVGLSLCFGLDDTAPLRGTQSTFPSNPQASHKMACDIERISAVLEEPLRLFLDLKSRRVPPRVWLALIDSFCTRGLIIDGIGSFDMDESRLIGKGCLWSSPHRAAGCSTISSCRRIIEAIGVGGGVAAA